MKKIVYIVICMICLFFCTEKVSAQTLAEKESAEQEQIKELEEQILQFANEGYGDLYGGALADLSDVQIEQAYTVYTNVTDIFDDADLSVDDLESALADKPVVWCVPVQYDDCQCIVQVSKGLPLNEENSAVLTEEQKQEIVKNENQWTVVCADYDAQNKKEMVQKVIKTSASSVSGEHTILFSGAPGTYGVLALACDEQKACSVWAVDAISDTQQDTDAQAASDITFPEENKVYSFAEFCEQVARSENEAMETEREEKETDVGGGVSEPVNYYAVFGLLVMAAVGAFLFLRYYWVR